MHEMHPFERQVADDVTRRMGPNRPVDDLAIFDALRDEPRGSRYTSVFSATRFAAAALVVMIFGGFLLMALLSNQQGDDGPPAGVVSSPSSSPTQTRTGPDPVPSPQETDMNPRSTIPAAIATASLLATAAPTAAADPMGGYTFERLTPLAQEKEMRVEDVVQLPDGRIVAFGGGYLPKTGGTYQVLHWSSEDGGESWQRSQPGKRFGSGGMAGVAVHDGQLFAAVSDDVKDRIDTWIYTSSDGVDWRQVNRLRNTSAGDLISTPDGLAMLGAQHRKADGWGDRLAPHPTLWLSDDGAEWEAHAIAGPPPTRKAADQRSLDTLIRAADGTWMAAGTHVKFRDGPEPLGHYPAVFRAGPDLAFAEITPGFLEEDDATMFQALAHTPDGFLFRALDTSDGNAISLWTTTDGSDWQQAAQMGSWPGIDTVAATDAGVIGWQRATGPDSEILSGSPVYRSATGGSWGYPSTEMLPDVSVANATVMPDGTLLIAANDITACENERCVIGPEGPKSPVVLVGTPS